MDIEVMHYENLLRHLVEELNNFSAVTSDPLFMKHRVMAFSRAIAWVTKEFLIHETEIFIFSIEDHPFEKELKIIFFNPTINKQFT